MTEIATGWSEENSQFFIHFGEIITPARQEQTEMILSLVPAEPDEQFIAVDLACGAGHLSGALLQRFRSCRVLALDGSPTMLDQTRETLIEYGDRLELRLFDFRQREWLENLPRDVRCFLSSLAIHHLDGREKQQLFRDLRERLAPNGALLIADLVEAVNDWARRAYGRALDATAKEQSARIRGSLDAYERFRDGWNHFITPDVEFDKPSLLFEQLRWLEEAGFSQVDCFWLKAGHAIYGGYAERSAIGRQQPG